MYVGLSVRRQSLKTEFEFLAFRPFSLSKLALIDADEDDDEEDDDEDEEEEDEDEEDEDDDEEDLEEITNINNSRWRRRG